jgi:hypothetical protein
MRLVTMFARARFARVDVVTGTQVQRPKLASTAATVARLTGLVRNAAGMAVR